MSHQIVAMSAKLPAQMIVLTLLTMLTTNNHIAIEIVGIVPARQCQGSGARQRAAEMKEAMGSSRCTVRGVR